MKQNILMLVVLLFLSSGCSKDVDFSVFMGIAFSFNEEVTIIEVDESVILFKLEGIINEDSNDIENGYRESPDRFLESMGAWTRIDSVRTTAKHNFHYIDKGRDNQFRREGETPNVYANIRLIPENIKTEVEIVYYSVANLGPMFIDPDGERIDVRPSEFIINAIDTTIIRLVPKKKQ